MTWLCDDFLWTPTFFLPAGFFWVVDAFLVAGFLLGRLPASPSKWSRLSMPSSSEPSGSSSSSLRRPEARGACSWFGTSSSVRALFFRGRVLAGRWSGGCLADPPPVSPSPGEDSSEVVWTLGGNASDPVEVRSTVPKDHNHLSVDCSWTYDIILHNTDQLEPTRTT